MDDAGACLEGDDGVYEEVELTVAELPAMALGEDEVEGVKRLIGHASGSLERRETEGGGKEVRERGALRCHGPGGIETWVENRHQSGVGAELEQGLAAGAAGHGGSVIQVGDGDGKKTDAGAKVGDGVGDGGLLRTGGEAVAGVLHVAAGDDLLGMRWGEQKGGADAEAAVGRIGIGRSGERLVAEIGEAMGKQWLRARV